MEHFSPLGSPPQRLFVRAFRARAQRGQG